MTVTSADAARPSMARNGSGATSTIHTVWASGATTNLETASSASARRRGEDREHQSPPRPRRVLLRLSDDEHEQLRAAAQRSGYTLAGYAAEATLAAAAGHGVETGGRADRAALREALAELMAVRTAVNRFGGNVNQAVAALRATGEQPVWLQDAIAVCRRAVARVDNAVAEVRRKLPR